MQRRGGAVKNNSAAMGQGLGPPQGRYINSTSEIFCRNSGPHLGEEWHLQAEHKIPRTSPCYLTSNHSKAATHSVALTPKLAC